MQPISEYEENDKDDETWMEGVSAISLDCEKDWYDDDVNENEVNDLQSAVTGYKSQAQTVKYSSKNTLKRGQGLICGSSPVVYTNKTLQLEYILSVWPDVNLNTRVSVHFCIESGKGSHKNIWFAYRQVEES